MSKHQKTHTASAAGVDARLVLRENEEKANRYTALCLLISAGVTALMWLLNIVGVFVVDGRIMNIFMPVGIVILVTPYFVMRFTRAGKGWLKYLILCAFILGISVMSISLTIHMVLAWACPIIISCHYYSPRLTRHALYGVLIFMLISIYVGLFVGVWDSNMMHLSGGARLYPTFADRWDYIMEKRQSGDDILRRVFIYYYLPRSVICVVVFLISTTLSKRTQNLLVKQWEISQEKERIGTELDIATHIQSSMLPCIFPAFPERPEIDIYATMDPAREVGGDFYDFFMVDETHLAIVMADVSGKGVPAALFMVIGKTLIKDHTVPGRDLGEVFTEVNRLLCESNSEGLFITAFEGVLDLETGRLVYVNAGHEMPFVCHKGEDFSLYRVRPGFVLAGMDGMRYRQGEMLLEPGDMLFQYTDGLTEATAAGGELFGMDRLSAALNRQKGRVPSDILPAVKAEIDAFVGDAPQFDDMTMLCLQYKGRMDTATDTDAE